MPEIQTLEDENLDEVNETIMERIVGLSEMFPDSVRNATCVTAAYALGGAKWMFNFSGKSLWIAGTSFMVLALPVIFEVERVQTEEAQLQQQRQILLGPSAAGGGGGYPGGVTQPQRR